MAAWCANAIVQNQDIIDTRQWIKRNWNEGASVREILKAIKRMTAAAVFLRGTNKLGHGKLNKIEEKIESHQVKCVELERVSE